MLPKSALLFVFAILLVFVMLMVAISEFKRRRGEMRICGSWTGMVEFPCALETVMSFGPRWRIFVRKK